ncbi:hypothetical protein MBSD_n1312 [Mizugakiibacter sediminis]|uniref:DUF3501 family protein n=1 Tax=Mizugakiibacter sediminis TaxID=1475481 RepID=A0A0K8QM71_9GAMM|nr:DUF3501 family protein [Mizugakiibacter sediminis]GAP66010.1 hypothetical protein MBSD_n1312 [Mizugakiibacter sediminis]
MHAAPSKLTPADLYTLEAYARERAQFRAKVLAHKKTRTVHLGEHLTLVFEDRLTVQYQVQEMLRIERIFEPAGIQDELDAYNPLIPDGRNLKATMLVEFEDPAQRKRELARLRGIEHHVSLTVAGHAPVIAVADEDLERSNEEKTSAVHFLRFELGDAMVAALRAGAALTLAVDHPGYAARTALPEATRRALLADLA